MKRSKTENRGGARSSAKDPKDNPSHRLQRVEGQIRDVISSYILRRMRRELPGIISVTRVVAASDIRAAKVMITAMDATGESGLTAEAYQKDAVEKLNLEAYAIQEEVDSTLRMKFCPKLTFVYDEGFEHAMKVENILRKISLDEAAKAKSAGGMVDGAAGKADGAMDGDDDQDQA